MVFAVTPALARRPELLAVHGAKWLAAGERLAISGALYCSPLSRGDLFLPRLIIRSSDIHAAGCFALENIPKGTRLLEYTGDRISKAEGDDRYEGREFTYLFGVGDGEVVIDGHGMAMFVNHSCDPNCETDEEGDRVFIASIADIAAGDELTYDYCLYDGDDDAPCYCGSKTCRGSMYSPEELKRKPVLKPRRKSRPNWLPRRMALARAKSSARGTALARKPKPSYLLAAFAKAKSSTSIANVPQMLQHVSDVIVEDELQGQRRRVSDGAGSRPGGIGHASAAASNWRLSAVHRSIRLCHSRC